MDIRAMAYRAHQTAVEKGFWPNGTGEQALEARFGEAIALIHSEASEALEDYRDNGLLGVATTYREEDGKPEGIGPELADIVIRVGDLAEALGIDLGLAVAEKMKFNETRPHRHGGKRA